MLKRKRTKGSRSQALIPEERSKREAPVEQLWERSWEGRKETNRKPSTRTVSKAWETRPGRTGRTVKARVEAAHWGSHCEAELGSAERKKQRLSSEMLKRKRTKGSGSQALIPEEKSKREAPVEQLWERSWEGRKETNRKPSTDEPEGLHGKPGRTEGGAGEAKAETEIPEKPPRGKTGKI